MGYINAEELRKFRELNAKLDEINQLTTRYDSSEYAKKLDIILQGMIKKLVGSSKRCVSQEALQSERQYRWGDSSYGLTSEGLCEAFGRRTSKGKVKLRKTNVLSHTYRNSQSYSEVPRKVIEFLKGLEADSNIKDTERLKDLISYCERINTLEITNKIIKYEAPCDVVLVEHPCRGDTERSEEYNIEATKITLSNRGTYGSSGVSIEYARKDKYSKSFHNPDWNDFQMVSLPKTYALLMRDLEEFRVKLEAQYQMDARAIEDLIAEKGEYIVMAEL